MFDCERFRTGDHEYFAEVMLVFGPAVLKVCRSFGPTEDDVDDLFQGVFFLAYEKRRTYRGDGPFGAWLNRIAKNHCVSVYRARKHEQRRLEDFRARGGVVELHPRGKDPQEELEWKEAERSFLEAVDLLPKKARQAVILRLIEDRSPDEVAAEMKISKASVRSNLSRATRRLRGIMVGGKR